MTASQFLVREVGFRPRQPLRGPECGKNGTIIFAAAPCHMATPIFRNGPAPKRCDTWATETSNAPVTPSRARMVDV